MYYILYFMIVVNGKKIAEDTLEKLKKEPTPKKYFAAVLVGNNSASASFVKKKEETAKALGVDFRTYDFPENITEENLREEILRIAQHKTCGAVLVQLPLPENINRHYVLNVIPKEKDVDVLGERALGSFYTNRNPILPPVVGTTVKILHSVFEASHEGSEDAVKQAHEIINNLKPMTFAIVGPGFLVGRPIASFLMGKTKGLHILGRKSDLRMIKEADVVISGVGKANLIKPEYLKEGTGVIDFGYESVNGKISGDLDSTHLSNKNNQLSFYTPTPGGTGPILVSQLFENFYALAKKQK